VADFFSRVETGPCLIGFRRRACIVEPGDDYQSALGRVAAASIAAALAAEPEVGLAPGAQRLLRGEP